MAKPVNECKTESIGNSFEKEDINMNLYRNFIDNVDQVGICQPVGGRDFDNLKPNTTHEE